MAIDFVLMLGKIVLFDELFYIWGHVSSTSLNLHFTVLQALHE